MFTKRKIIFFISFIVFISSLIVISIDYYYKNTSEIKTTGGVYAEGVIGSFTCFNPIFCTSDIDFDIGELIFSSLGKYDPEKRKIVPDLAEKWTISDDRLTYVFYLRKNVYWHDGVLLDADDVIFTYKNILQSKDLNLPSATALSDIEIVKIDKFTVLMRQKKPDAFFLRNITYPIMPKHILQSVPESQLVKAAFNVSPIGSGMYKFKSFNVVENIVTLSLNEKYYGKKGFIKNIEIHAFDSYENLFKNIHKLNAIKNVPIEFKNLLLPNFKTYEFEFPQYVALFFNMKNKLLNNQTIRDAISEGINIKELIKLVDNAKKVYNPVFLDQKLDTDIYQYNKEEAQNKLKSIGFKLNEKNIYTRKNILNQTEEKLSFNLLVLKNNNYEKIAKKIQQDLKNIGIDIKISILDISDFKEKLKNRDYDMLLFGQNLGSDVDLFPYWHSSQVEYPGLNISYYKNPDMDNLLEKLRTESDGTKHNELLNYISQRLIKDKPAIFLYIPTFIFAISDEIKDFEVKYLSSYKDRFAYINNWYIKSKRTWNSSLESGDIIIKQ